MESCSGFKGLDQESWKSLHPDGLHQESIWRIPGAHQGSMMVHSGCYLKRGPDGLQEAWLSVRPSEAVTCTLKLARGKKPWEF